MIGGHAPASAFIAHLHNVACYGMISQHSLKRDFGLHKMRTVPFPN
jgi:hypothetical protein